MVTPNKLFLRSAARVNGFFPDVGVQPGTTLTTNGRVFPAASSKENVVSLRAVWEIADGLIKTANSPLPFSRIAPFLYSFPLNLISLPNGWLLLILMTVFSVSIGRESAVIWFFIASTFKIKLAILLSPSVIVLNCSCKSSMSATALPNTLFTSFPSWISSLEINALTALVKSFPSNLTSVRKPYSPMISFTSCSLKLVFPSNVEIFSSNVLTLPDKATAWSNFPWMAEISLAEAFPFIACVNSFCNLVISAWIALFMASASTLALLTSICSCKSFISSS